MSNSFSNNPFAALQEKVTPKPSAKTASSVSKAHNKPSTNPAPKPKAQPKLDVDDSELFLQAVHNTKPNTKKSNRLTALVDALDFDNLSKQKVLKKTSSSKQDSSITSTMSKPTSTALDDDHVFFKAMQEVAPLTGKGREIVPEISPITTVSRPEQSYEDLMESRVEFALALKGEYLEGHVVGLDEDIMNGLRSGRYSPEAHLDLHGLNAMQAYQALINFFRGSWYKGFRAVLVVPGRGKNSLNGYGILRDKLQTWLTQDPFKRVVLAFCTARPVDGGPGSVYVLLRKYKKKGKIHWERLPSDPDLF